MMDLISDDVELLNPSIVPKQLFRGNLRLFSAKSAGKKTNA
jgi:hypothetical protein